jgi:hypothetical protein
LLGSGGGVSSFSLASVFLILPPAAFSFSFLYPRAPKNTAVALPMESLSHVSAFKFAKSGFGSGIPMPA